MTANALAQRQDLLPDAGTWKTMLSMAEELVKSGLLPQTIKTPAAALAIIQTGQELGIPPMYALRNIGVIGGKPVVGAEVMLAMIYRDHGGDALQFEETSDTSCTVLYRRRGWAAARRFSWTIEDAKQAGLLDKGGPWKQYPPAMLRARAISAVARLAFPDTIGGMYTPDELGADVDVIDGEVVVREQSPPVVHMVPSQAEQAQARRSVVGGAVVKDNEAPRSVKSTDVIQPTEPEEERAHAMQRPALEAEYTRLAALAVERGHKNAAKIQTKQAKDLTDELLAGSVTALQGWEAKLPPVDEDEAL